MPGKILFVLTSHQGLDASGLRTGFHFGEVAVPYYLLQDADIPVVLASIAGGTPHPDPRSINNTDTKNNPLPVRRFLNDIEAMYKLENTRPLEKHDLHNFSAIYLAGGHGAIWDFPDFKPLQRLILEAYTEKKHIAAIGHGAAALVGVKANNDYIVRGRRLCPFTDSAQRAMGTGDLVPFLLESRLREQGAQIIRSHHKPACVEDGPFLTSPDAASAPLLGARLRDSVLRRIREPAVPL